MGTVAYRLILSTLILVLIGLSTYLFMELMSTRREYQAFKERHMEAQHRLQVLREERDQREAYLRAFLNDPEFVERVVRERLGYVQPGEILFRFED